MKLRLVMITLILLCHQSLASRSNNYSLTARVWNFLKYHHPALMSGKVDPDDFLITKLLSQIDSTSRPTEVSSVIRKGIDHLESIYPVTEREMSPWDGTSFHKSLDLSWIVKASLAKGLKSRLHFIHRNYPLIENELVKVSPFGGHPVFKTDSGFFDETEAFKQKELRLLALFRLWGIIEYFYPSKYLTLTPWSDVLEKLVPRFLSASDEISYNKACLFLNSFITDSHAVMTVPKDKELRGSLMLPLELTNVQGEVVVSSNLDKTHEVPRGSILVSIDGLYVKDRSKVLAQYISASNGSFLQNSINNWLLFTSKTHVSLRYKYQGQFHRKLVSSLSPKEYFTRLRKSQFRRPAWSHIKGRYGLVNMDVLQEADIEKMFTELWDTEGLIIDLRGYPNGTLWSMVNYLYEAPTPTHRFSVVSPYLPGMVNMTPPMSHNNGLSFSKTYNKQIAILMDSSTISQGEFTIMGFEQAKNVVKIGGQTAGADGTVTKVFLPGGVSTYFSSLGVYYPDKTKTQGVGIVPDFRVSPNFDDVEKGRDALLEFALKYLDRKSRQKNEGSK